ncbi:MAG: macro domain-containing protein [Solobacterium sp.]|nr:macro domain-containing protein [Solobacterium sp.]
MPLRIVRDDILQIYADIIVNAASFEPVIGKGTETAIYQAAGRKELLEQRKKIGIIKEGDAAISPAFRLNADYLIHTVCPVWRDGKHGEAELLASCYRKTLALAKEYDAAVTAIPLLAAGTRLFPNELALEVAVGCLEEFLQENDMTIYLVVPDRNSFAIASDLFDTVSSYIDRNQTGMMQEPAAPPEYNAASMSAAPFHDTDWEMEDTVQLPVYEESFERREKLSWYINPRKEQTFQVRLLKLIDESGETDPVIYKRANLDRKLFAKIRKDENYHPAKKTAIAFALALKLSMDDTVDLLERAGFALSKASTFDLIIRYCIENKIYNIVEVNMILFSFDQELL